MYLGLGWDAGCDLDAWCYLVGPNGESVDIVYFAKLRSTCDSVRHSGDNLTGEGEGDDEQIRVNVSAIPATVQHLFFVVQIYSQGRTFREVSATFN
jgi:tellurium resistance protein TerZ